MGTVRDAAPEDSKAVAAVHVQSWKAAYRGVLPDEYLDRLSVLDRRQWWEQRLRVDRDVSHHIVVVEDDEGNVVGFGSAGPSTAGDPRTAEVSQLYLEPRVWGRGLGQEVLDELVARLRADGYAAAVLWVAPANARARRFYERCGWMDARQQKTEEMWGVEARAMKYERCLDA